jgi:hypothetical protein
MTPPSGGSSSESSADEDGTRAQSDDATDPEADPDAAAAALELAVLLEDPPSRVGLTLDTVVTSCLRSTTWSLTWLQATNC